MMLISYHTLCSQCKTEWVHSFNSAMDVLRVKYNDFYFLLTFNILLMVEKVKDISFNFNRNVN